MVMACILALNKSMIGVFLGKITSHFEIFAFTLFPSNLQYTHSQMDDGRAQVFGQRIGHPGHALEGKGLGISLV